MSGAQSMVANGRSLTAKNVEALPQGPMLDEYLRSAQSIDKLVSSANKQNQTKMQKDGSLKKSSVKELELFMASHTDKNFLRQGRKDAAALRGRK